MTAELKQKTVVVSTIDEIKKLTDTFRGGTIGLVPTMGYLHNGHMNLVKQSLNKCDHTVGSIFINPRQFSPSEDLDIYPSNLAGDIEKLESIGVDALFYPNRDTIYPLKDLKLVYKLMELPNICVEKVGLNYLKEWQL